MKTFLSRTRRWLSSERASMSIQSIGLVAVAVAVVLGAWGVAEIQGNGPVGRIMFAYLEQQTDRLAGRDEGQVDYSDGKTNWSVGLVPPESQLPEDRPPVDPSLWDRLLSWFDRVAGGIEAAIADLGDLLSQIGDWFGNLPDWAKITLTAIAAAFIVVGIVVILVIAGVSLPLTGAALVIATIAAAVIAAIAVVIYGLTHPGDAFKFLEGLGLGVLAGIGAIALTFLGVIFGPTILAWLTGTAWPWLTAQVAAAWGWLTGQAAAAWGWLARTAWPWLLGRASAGWALLRGAASWAWTLLRGRFWPWLTGTALPQLGRLIMSRWKPLLAHYAGYAIIRYLFAGAVLGLDTPSGADLALDLGFMTVGVVFGPLWVAKLGLPAKGALTSVARGVWSAFWGAGRAAVTQFQANGINVFTWNWASIGESAGVSGVSRVVVGGSDAESVTRPFLDRVLRTLVQQRDSWIERIFPTQTPSAPGSPTPTPTPPFPTPTPTPTPPFPTPTPTPTPPYPTPTPTSPVQMPTPAPTGTGTPSVTPTATSTATSTSTPSATPSDAGSTTGTDPQQPSSSASESSEASELLRRIRQRLRLR